MTELSFAAALLEAGHSNDIHDRTEIDDQHQLIWNSGMAVDGWSGTWWVEPHPTEPRKYTLTGDDEFQYHLSGGSGDAWGHRARSAIIRAMIAYVETLPRLAAGPSLEKVRGQENALAAWRTLRHRMKGRLREIIRKDGLDGLVEYGGLAGK